MGVIDIILLVAIILIAPPTMAAVLCGVRMMWREFIIDPIQHRWATFQNNRLNGRRR